MKEILSNTKVTSEKLVKVLKNGKDELGSEQAVQILLFLKKLARIVVRKYLEK